MPKLTPKQQAFVAEYLVDLNASQAAIRAGYSPRTARSQGNRLLTNVNIAEVIHRAQSEAAQRNDLTQDYVLSGLRGIADDPGQSGAPRVRALELLGKHQGMFVDRVDHTSKGEAVGVVSVNVYMPANDRDTETGEGEG